MTQALVSQTARKKQALGLKKELGAKLKKLSVPVTQRIELLCQGDSVPRLNLTEFITAPPNSNSIVPVH